MANPEHLAILKSGVNKWNRWRKKNKDIRPDLSAADLFEADLRGVNLSKADLTRVHLSEADLSRADLYRANLDKADLRWADLTGAEISYAYLSGANLSWSNLRGANLSGANLHYAVLHHADLTGTESNAAELGYTHITCCDSLHLAHNLHKVEHDGPSALDRQTLQDCIHGLPDVFLQDCGYTQHEIDYLRALYVNSPIKYFSCFISHGEPDLAFADRLLADLRQKNVTCWHYKVEGIGDRI